MRGMRGSMPAATHWMPGALSPVVTTKNVFRHVQMFLGGVKIAPD